MDDTIKRSNAIKWFEPYADRGLKIPVETVIQNLKDIPSVEKQSENATRCYEFLKTRLGEGIVDSEKEFESWYERMVWHVKECDKLAREPKQGEWIDMGDFEQCSVCKGTHLKEFQSYYGKTTWIKTPYCPNCGADMRKGADDE